MINIFTRYVVHIEQIRISITVDISNRRAGCKQCQLLNGRGNRFLKCPVAVIQVDGICPDICNVQIRKPIVIDIANCTALTKTEFLQAALLCDIIERHSSTVSE